MSKSYGLSAPILYWRIKHPLKRRIDRYAPVSVGVSSAIVVGCWSRLDVFGSPGLVVGINSLLQILTGFFITSLSVTASFKGEVYKIDDPFEGSQATLDGDILTRRQFLAHLFAYLACACLVLYLSGVLALTGAVTLHGAMPGFWHTFARAGVIGLYMAGVAHVIGSALLGVMFLSVRFTRLSPRDQYGMTVRKELLEDGSRVPTEQSDV